MVSADPIRVYVCYEPDQRLCADRLDSWPLTNGDLDEYDRRVQVSVDSAAAEPLKAALAQRIRSADVTICVIGTETSLSDWIAWELSVSRSETGRGGGEARRNGLVGIVLHEYDRHPPAMVDSGAIFVRFKRDLVERAVLWAVAEPHSSDDFTLEDE